MPEEYAEVVEPQFKQVELTPAEADLMGEAMMNTINSALNLGDVVKYFADIMLMMESGDEAELLALQNKVMVARQWAAILLDQINEQTARAGLGMPQ